MGVRKALEPIARLFASLPRIQFYLLTFVYVLEMNDGKNVKDGWTIF